MLLLVCDICKETYYIWDTTRENTERVVYNDLYRENLCGNCKTALSLATRDLEPWADIERKKFQDEYDLRKQELIKKYQNNKQ